MSYGDGIHGVRGESPECLSALGPRLREVELTVERDEGSYVLTDGGCRLPLTLEGGVLSNDNFACELVEGSALVGLGVTERFYDHFRLDITTKAVEYAYRQVKRDYGGDALGTTCFVFLGVATPQADD